MTQPAIPGPNVVRSADGKLLAQGPAGPQGIQGPPGAQGPAGTARTVFRVAGSGTVTASGPDATVFADPGNSPGTPGSPTVTVFAAPGDGDKVTVLDTTISANATTQKIGVTAGGAHIEDPQNPGTFSTGTVYITQPGATVAWQWDNAKSHGKMV